MTPRASRPQNRPSFRAARNRVDVTSRTGKRANQALLLRRKRLRPPQALATFGSASAPYRDSLVLRGPFAVTPGTRLLCRLLKARFCS